MKRNNEFDFLYDLCNSYGDFQGKITPNKKKENLDEFFKCLRRILSSWEQQLEGIEHPAAHSSHSSFFVNLLWFYRWLVSGDYREYDEEEIDCLFQFLNRLRVPDLIVQKVPWGIVFVQKEDWLPDEEFWEKQVLKYISQRFGISLTLSHCFSLWLMYHVGLKQLFKDSWSPFQGLSAVMDSVLTRYINLVTQYPELEKNFGITIEKDMHRIYELVRWGKRGI